MNTSMNNSTSILKNTLSVCVAFILYTFNAGAKVVLPSIFSDNMVLQQKTNAAIWGKGDPGKTVTVITSWNRKKYSSKVDATGSWKIKVITPVYGGPYDIVISDGEELTLKNVLIGEVWICSGQSNMEMPLAGWGKVKNYEKEIAAANYPKIRLLQAVHVTGNLPFDDAKVTGDGWLPCSPQSVAEFSSVAYFFAREIYKNTGIPIGLMHTSWGGTIVEAWTSGLSLKKIPALKESVLKVEQSASQESTRKYTEELQEWQNNIVMKDSGYDHGTAAWAMAITDAGSWKSMQLPSMWEERGLPGFDGVVWFRKKVIIPASWAGKDLKLQLGTIDDNDITFFNGERIGETQGYNIPRNYTIAGNKVKAGENLIAIRVFDGGGGGGPYGTPMSLIAANGESLPLAGDWEYRVGLNLQQLPAPVSQDGPNRPTVLFNAMIHPFIRFSIRGAIWYQGEANVQKASDYYKLFPALIDDWRMNWAQGNFPFYYVQLANFGKESDQPVASAWAELRDAQLHTLSTPGTAMVVAIDLGEAADIHPKNKQEVGRRLALAALAKNYGKKIAYSGPLFKSQKVAGNKITLAFTMAETGLKAKDGKRLTGFAIAGADRKFYWANAVIENNMVVVSSPDVPAPLAVRYAWANNPDCNLVNKAGLPASPFRTDGWPLSTE